MAPKMNLVLGGDGLVGTALCDEIGQRGETAISLDLKSGFDLRSNNLDRYSEADRVWFLAWDVGGWKYLSAKKAQQEIFLNNCQICCKVFAFLERTSIPFLFVSSQMAGGCGAYGDTKLLGEQWTTFLGGKIVRLWNVYGWESPGVRSHAIPDFVCSGLAGEVICGSNGQERRQFIYKSDCAKGLWEAFNAPGNCYDLSSGKWIRVGDIAQKIGRYLNVPVRFAEKSGFERIVEPCNNIPGWTPKVALAEGIRAVIHDARGEQEEVGNF